MSAIDQDEMDALSHREAGAGQGLHQRINIIDVIFILAIVLSPEYLDGPRRLTMHLNRDLMKGRPHELPRASLSLFKCDK